MCNHIVYFFGFVFGYEPSFSLHFLSLSCHPIPSLVYVQANNKTCHCNSLNVLSRALSYGVLNVPFQDCKFQDT